jgi:hypothetical protein
MRLLIVMTLGLLVGRAEANPRARTTVGDVESVAVRMAGLLTARESALPRWADVAEPKPEVQRSHRDETPTHLATATIAITVPRFEHLAPQALAPVRVSLSFLVGARRDPASAR